MTFQFKTQISETLPYFAGHFPGNPLMPGFALVEMSWEFLKSADAGFSRYQIENAKILRPVLPNTEVEIRIEVADTAKGKQATVTWLMAADHSDLALFVFAAA